MHIALCTSDTSCSSYLQYMTFLPSAEFFKQSKGTYVHVSAKYLTWPLVLCWHLHGMCIE